MSNLEYKVGLVTDLSLHSLILFIFLTSFFLLYVSKLSIKTANIQLSRLIDRDFGKFVSENKSTFKSLSIPLNMIPYQKLEENYKKDDIYQKTNNEWLTRDLITVNILFFMLVFMGISTVIGVCGININFKEILLMNIMTFVCVGCIEYLFFTKIILNYSPTTPTFLMNTILNTAKKYFS